MPIATLSKTLKQIRREHGGMHSGNLPVIDLSVLSFVEITAAARRALLAANAPERFFRFGGVPCRIVCDEHGNTITEVLNIPKMRHVLARIAQWFQMQLGGSVVEVAPPQHTVEDVLATPDPPLPVLAGIVNTPVFSPSGELETEPGYHASTQLLYIPGRDCRVPPVSPKPSAAEIAEAKRLLLNEVLGDFPFDGPPSNARGGAPTANLRTTDWS
jgi:putative DNA primase/helicase